MPTSFHKALETEFASRCRRNGRYSLRAFARDLGLSASRLSEVMHDGQPPSRASVLTICRGLKISSAQAAFYCDEIDAIHNRSKSRRRDAAERVEKARAGKPVHEYTDEFRLIADWYHFGILSLAQTHDWRSDYRWIGRRLGIGADTVLEAIERLCRLGLLRRNEDGGFHLRTADSKVNDGITPDSMRRYHEQILNRCRSALAQQSRSERYISGYTIAIPSQAINELVEAAKAFESQILNIAAKYEDSGSAEEVYYAGNCIFRLSVPNERVKSEVHGDVH